MVHRLLYRCLQGNPIHANERDTYDEMAAHASTREADAAEAERTSIHYMQARYMQDKVGQIFDGMITGLSKSGMFVAERETKCEGMIAFRNIGNDYYSFDPKESVVWGEKTGAEFRAGDQVRIKLLKVDVENRMIDYGLVV
jgi:ribonuclease R